MPEVHAAGDGEAWWFQDGSVVLQHRHQQPSEGDESHETYTNRLGLPQVAALFFPEPSMSNVRGSSARCGVDSEVALVLAELKKASRSIDIAAWWVGFSWFRRTFSRCGT